MTGPNTNDQGNAGGTNAGGGNQNAGGTNAGGSSGAASDSNNSQTGAASSRTTTTRTRTVQQTDAAAVSDGVKFATGEEGHDDPAEGVTRTDGGAQEREDERQGRRRGR